MRSSTALTLGEAAKITGQSKPTLSRAIQRGKISATKDEDGSWMIEPAELFRVYERKPDDNPEQTTADETLGNPSEQGGVTGDSALVAALRDQIEDLRESRDRERSLVTHLQTEVEQGRLERARLLEAITQQSDQVRLLTDQRIKAVEEPAQPERRWWFGRRSKTAS